MFVIKLLGLIFLFCTFSLAGFRKAYFLKKRCSKLLEYLKGLNASCEYIRVGNINRSLLIKRCFDNSLLVEKDGKILINDMYLDKEDQKILAEFFDSFGSQNKQSELEKTKLYITLLNDVYKEASSGSKELCRLYSSLGLLSGAMACVFFL